MGTRERWPEVEKLFIAARECEPSRQAAFLTAACGEDEELRQEVESLLAEDETAGSFLEVPAVDLYTTAPVEDEAATAKSDSGRRSQSERVSPFSSCVPVTTSTSFW